MSVSRDTRKDINRITPGSGSLRSAVRHAVDTGRPIPPSKELDCILSEGVGLRSLYIVDLCMQGGWVGVFSTSNQVGGG